MAKPRVPDRITDDRTCSLSTLRAQAGQPLRNVVLDIHNRRSTSNSKSIKFLDNLKCFLPSETGNGRHLPDHGRQARPVTLIPCSRVQVKDYVAISYTWGNSYGESNRKGGYMLLGKRIRVRDAVLARTIRFIRYKQDGDMTPFWIDQLSIDQHNQSEHELGMQSMDRVYRDCKFAVGLLWVEMKTQVQMDCLSSLLSNQIVKDKSHGQHPVLEEGVDTRMETNILDLLVQITDDQWWSRAWIFQEDYLAGEKMWLLIRHAPGLDKARAQNQLGNLSGELVVKSERFRKYATLFCLALQQKTDQSHSVKSVCEKVIQKAGKYTVLHKHRDGYAMTINILKDLNKRNISVPSDLLAITANVCGYGIRIPAPKKNSPKTSLSLDLLTLCISNGEMLRNDRRRGSPYGDISDFLENHRMEIRAPLPDKALTFIKHCRLSVTHLSPTGIHTEGILWRLGDMIQPSLLRNSRLSNRENPDKWDLYRDGLNDYQRSRLSDLVQVLDQQNKQLHRRNKQLYKRFADELTSHLQRHNQFTWRDDWPPEFHKNIMAACIVNAMDTGKYLQLARPIGGSHDEGRGIPYRAVFVRDDQETPHSGPTYVITSWNHTDDQTTNLKKCKTLAKYMSMEVSVDETSQRPTSLRSKRWINGLCFFGGEEKYPFVFPWPESLWE